MKKLIGKRQDFNDMSRPICTINLYGDKFWKLNRKYHREDGPAIEYYYNGEIEWYYNGKRICGGIKR